LQKHVEKFYCDMWEELSKFGDLDEVYICTNMADHLTGNVYVKFFEEDDAKKVNPNSSYKFFGASHVCVCVCV